MILLDDILNQDEISSKILRKELKEILKWVKRERKIKPNLKDDDLIHEALLRLYTKRMKPDLNIKAKTYIMGIIRNIIKEENRNREYPTPPNRMTGLGVEENLIFQLEIEESYKLLQQMLLKLPQKCQELIDLAFYDNIKSEEICARLGYSSKSVVYKKKKLCLDKFRVILANNYECCMVFDIINEKDETGTE